MPADVRWTRLHQQPRWGVRSNASWSRLRRHAMQSAIDSRQGTAPRGSFVVQLKEVSGADLSRVGSKAANLGELSRAGFPVPDGFILTIAAFERFTEANGLRSDSTLDEVTAARVPADVQNELRANARPWSEVPLAVRSSGVAEDLPGASFAGQYETVLGTRGFDELVAAVRTCWSSAFSTRVS